MSYYYGKKLDKFFEQCKINGCEVYYHALEWDEDSENLKTVESDSLFLTSTNTPCTVQIIKRKPYRSATFKNVYSYSDVKKIEILLESNARMVSKWNGKTVKQMSQKDMIDWASSILN